MSDYVNAGHEKIFRNPDDIFDMFLPKIVQAHVEGGNHPTNLYGIVSSEPHPIVNDLGEDIEIHIPTTIIPTGGGVVPYPLTIMERKYLLPKEVFANQVNMYQKLRDSLVDSVSN